MRSIWSGAISFGLVHIPVKLYNSTRGKELSFNLLHKADFSPIRYAKICRADGHEIPTEEIVKGYEYQKGDYVVLDDQDFEHANPEKTKTIEIYSFVNEGDIDSIYYEKPYYIEPEKTSAKAYFLLRKALEGTKKVALGKFILRNREHLMLIKPYKEALILNQLRFEEEIAPVETLQIPKADVNEAELRLAVSLIESMSLPFKPAQYTDTYTKELEEVIEQKIEGKVPAVKGHVPEPTPVKDLMTMLKQSLEKAEHRRQKAR